MNRRHALQTIAAAGTLAVTGRACGAYSNGPLAYGRWCSNPRCGMCAQIEARNRALASHRVAAASARRESTGVTTARFEPTPHDIVEEMLDVAKPKPYETLVDLGAGDGRILIAAARKYGCRCVGFEIDRDTAQLAYERVAKAGLSDRVTVYRGDARTADLTGVDIVTVYLFPDLLAELEPKLLGVPRVVSYSHPPILGVPIVCHPGAIFEWRAEVRRVTG